MPNIAFAENVETPPPVINNSIELNAAFKEMSNILPSVKAAEVLNLAKHYYSLSSPKVETAAKVEYKRIVNWTPSFTGTKTDAKKAKGASAAVALAVSYTNAKNFYLSMASAVFALDSKSIVGAGNFASAIASYYDDLLIEGKTENNMGKYYIDAIKVYNYGLKLSIKDSMFSKDALSLLISLGNIYMDTGKKDNAYKCFRMAIAMDKGYWPARKAMYNY